MSENVDHSHPDWHQADNFLIGYGSLLSADSRLRFSDNPHPAISVTLQGFQRSWITRAFHEDQTYVGVLPNTAAEINAHCVPIALNPSLQQREQDYRFVQVEHGSVMLNGCQNAQLWEQVDKSRIKLWICESLQSYPANTEFPINLSYIDTCLSGCIHHYGSRGEHSNSGYADAKRFIETTTGWQNIVDDRSSPRYPRAAHLSHSDYVLIDELLELK